MIVSSLSRTDRQGKEGLLPPAVLAHMVSRKEHAAGNREAFDQGAFCFETESMTEAEADSPKRFENHRKYIDLHLIIEGAEKYLIDDPAVLTRETEYQEEADKEFFAAEGDRHIQLVLRSGDFVMLYPGEAHCCCIAAEKPAVLKKRIYKIPVHA